MIEMACKSGLLWPVLCVTWTLAWILTPSGGSSVSPIFLRTTALPAVEDRANSTVTPITFYKGSFSIEKGTGVSVGTVVAFWCHIGFQLVGSEQIFCILKDGLPQWSNYIPVCEAIHRPENRGLRVAVLASVVSGIIILTMSVSFIICCLQACKGKNTGKQREGRNSRRTAKHQSCQRSECWLEREGCDRDVIPASKVYHLSQCPEPRLPFNRQLYAGGLTAYENHGYQSSHENLLNTSLPCLYRTESPVYPHVVLQRVYTPTAPTVPSAPSAPMYLHLSNPTLTDNPQAQPVLPPYPKPHISSSVTKPHNSNTQFIHHGEGLCPTDIIR